MTTKEYIIWHLWMAALQYLAVNNQQTTGTKIVCFDTAEGT
jgi:hypothetical protein